MPGPRLRALLVLAFLGAALGRAVRLLRRRSAPDMSRHPVIDGGVRPPRPASDRHSVTDFDPATAIDGLAAAAASDAEPITIDEAAALVDVARHSGLVADPVPDETDRQPVHGTQLVEEPVTSLPVTPVEGTPAVESTTTAPTASEVSWVVPDAGACPEGFPVKAKLRSGIYHMPGMLAYDRTSPDRCYPSAEAAAADGLRAAKR